VLAAHRSRLAASALGRRTHRVEQTVRTFSNWAPILGRLGGGRHLSEAVTFRTRTGVTITCPNVPGARVPVYEIFAEDCYQVDSFLAPLADRPIKVIDIGAHVGAFACQLAATMPAASIYCFEPSATTAGYLRRNIEANGFADRVFVEVAAVSDTSGWGTLADNGAGSALNGLVSDDASDSAATKVATTTFDDVVAAIGAPVDVVKIDCEGGEYDAVLGSSPASWAGVSRVVLEYHPHPKYGWPQLRDWFAEQGLEPIRESASSAEQGAAWLIRPGQPSSS
jgi:FkbM family methyltransferase